MSIAKILRHSPRWSAMFLLAGLAATACKDKGQTTQAKPAITQAPAATASAAINPMFPAGINLKVTSTEIGEPLHVLENPLDYDAEVKVRFDRPIPKEAILATSLLCMPIIGKCWYQGNPEFTLGDNKATFIAFFRLPNERGRYNITLEFFNAKKGTVAWAEFDPFASQKQE